MTERGADEGSDENLRRTVERLEQTTKVDEEQVRETYQEYREGSDTEDPDEFLEYLLDEEVIDGREYVTASSEEPVHLDEDGRFEHLPTRATLYNLLGAFDEGGMGKICVGHDPHLDRKVAVKILREEKAESGLERRRFLREAQVTGKLAHPNIVPIHTIHSEDDGRASFSMKLIDGDTLFDLIWDAREMIDRDEPLEGDYQRQRRLETFLRVCDAMSYAHNRGVIHRDLKPSNIMVGAYNEVYVMDWGIAKVLETPSEEDEVLWEREWEAIDEDDEVKTQAGSLIGTPPYMPPEQAKGEHEELDRRSDLFSLGAILFEMVTLRRMIPGDKVYDVLQNVIEGERVDFACYNPDEELEPELQAIIEKATAPNKHDRYETVEAFADDIRNFINDKEVSAHPDGPVRKVQRWMTHNRDMALGIALGLVMIAAVAVISSLYRQMQSAQANRHREAQLSRLQAHVSKRAHKIDRQFLRFELLTRRLALTAREHLSQPPEYGGPLYSSNAFEKPSTSPAETRKSPLYGKRISLQTPVFKLAPGVAIGDVEPTLRKLMPLKEDFRSIFLDSRLDDGGQPPSGEQLWETMAVDGVPARWAYVSTETGIHFSYPGKGGYPDDYDPRQRPWYKSGKEKMGLGWVNPYRDTQGQGLVLPCVTPVTDAEGDLQGFAGLEVTLDFIQRKFMKPSGPMVDTYVLNEKGQILVSSDSGQSAQQEKLPRLPVPRVLTMVKQDESGIYAESKMSADDVYAVYRMPTLDWFYVAKAPLDELLAWES